LRHLAIETGCWTLQPNPVSSTPQLTYARELQQLQRRYGAVLIDRLRLPGRRPPPAGGNADLETADTPVHDDLEMRVVLAGQARFAIAAGAAGGWSVIGCAPGDWIVLPAGLPHALLPEQGAPLDLLRMFTRPRGWVARRCDAGRPPPLLSLPALALAA
jgi:cupin superfamily acireductone dioxygenase involved in methionine salvage